MQGSAQPVEMRAPDLSDYRQSSTGIDYVETFDSSRPGPHVLLSAVVHGNELCGAIVLDELHREKVRPRRGRLSLGFVNVAAMDRFDPEHPTLSRFVDEDFNRLWSEVVLAGRRRSVELDRARELRPFLDTVDYLLDVHSMQYGTAPLALCGPTAKGRKLARSLGYPPHVVSDAGHAAGTRMRDYGGFADEDSRHNALLIECGQHWRAATVDAAREIVWRFLAHFELVDRALAHSKLTRAPVQQRVIEVTTPITVRTGSFRFADSFQGLEVIEKAGTVIGRDGTTPVTTPYDDCVLIMPSRRLSRGGTAVRLGRYVDR